MAAYEVLLLNTAIPQIQAAQTGDTYVVPRDIAFSAAAFLANGTNSAPSLAFSSDTDTGVFRPGTNSLAFAVGGTQAMTLDASGRLGIANTNPGVSLEIGSDTSTVRALAVRYSSVPAYLSNSYDGSVGLTTLSCNSYNTSSGSATWSSFANSGYSNSAIQLATGTSGADIRFLTAAAANTNPTERARITSDGNFLVGGVTDNSTNNVFVTSSTIGFIAGSATPQINYYSSASTIEYVNRNSGGAKTFSWYFGASGGGSPATLSTSGVWTNASDARGKENIQDIIYGLAQVLALQPRQYDVKSDNSHAVGFVAQEVKPVIPELVHVTRRDENGEYYGLDYGSMTAVLVKAIQEQQAMINELKAEVVALKGA